MRGNYVDGRWAPAADGNTYTKASPMRPSETVGELASSSETDVERAVASAADAFASWGRLPLAKRGSYLVAAAAALRGSRGGDRARHVERDGQAAARGAR